MKILSELKRRNVFRVAAAYAVLSWLLIQIAETLGDTLDLPDWAGKLVVLLLVIGFIPAVMFSWVYELTPEGIKRESEVPKGASITGQTARKLDIAVLVMLAIAIGLFAVDRFVLDREEAVALPTEGAVSEPADTDGAGSTPPEVGPEPEADQPDMRSVAVLPFENRSPDPDNAYFTDGIHDDLLTLLAKIGDLTVISRTSVLQYRDTTKPIPEIADELGVAHVMEGAVQRAGNQVRINVQLIEAESDNHLWAETFDRELTPDNLFAIQSEIAGAIAIALKATLSPEEEKRLDDRPTDNLAAYEAYLKAKQLMPQRTAAQLAEARDLMERAIALDPEFAAAHAQLANIIVLLANYTGQESKTVLPEARRHADRALLLDPQLGEGYAALGSILTDMGDYDGARRAFERAIEYAPNLPEAYHWYGMLLRRPEIGELDAALTLHHKAVALDPNSPVIAMTVPFDYIFLGQVQKGRDLLDDIERRFPQYALVRTWQGVLNATVDGDLVTALSKFREAERLAPGNVSDNTWICNMQIQLMAFESAESCLAGYAANAAVEELSLELSNLAIADGDTEIAAALMQDALDADPHSYLNQLWLIQALLIAGRYEEARAAVGKHWGSWTSGEVPAIDDPNDANQALLTGHTLQRTGEVEKGRGLIEAALDYFRNHRDSVAIYWGQDILALAALGRTEEALDAMQAAVANGWRFGWLRFEHSDLVQNIREHPRFREQMRILKADLARQREQAEARGLM